MIFQKRSLAMVLSALRLKPKPKAELQKSRCMDIVQCSPKPQQPPADPPGACLVSESDLGVKVLFSGITSSQCKSVTSLYPQPQRSGCSDPPASSPMEFDKFHERLQMRLREENFSEKRIQCCLEQLRHNQCDSVQMMVTEIRQAWDQRINASSLVYSIRRWCAPLFHFQWSLDTLSQTCTPLSAAWGVSRIFLQVLHDLTDVPDSIATKFECLQDHVPIFEAYKIAFDEDPNVVTHNVLVRVYVEFYIIFLQVEKIRLRSASKTHSAAPHISDAVAETS
ncbi:hypothetical protein EJ05DRAFT_381841 [Pseudovirgaria hyperparasitica]|uniref:Uncharacterized protein n=1 Tax=Pseudovirgaria hyperparasitica TaxID=470096 RepID=A0A6A6W8E7_9PEZI|nr:uncharacterized protein EJ05DRAFT_381841 [Pseudovirgaria hyperparasitica]KAF2758230.1 hypothetical protein EJ05DRAFT_381841 [Pseudovirgaria hyperparasitica]